MSTLNPEIQAGEKLAKNLKEYFYQGEEWTPTLASKLGHMMTRVKHRTRIAYPEMDNVALLTHLGGYSKQDVEDALHENV